MTTHEISNSEDVIDSRDVIERIGKLQDERQAYADEAAEFNDDTNVLRWSAEHKEAEDALAEWDEENADELAALLALAEEGEEATREWSHGETLIRDSYFEQYARELADELGLPENGASWPYTFIDWEQAADELQCDYTYIDFDGVDYWIRNV